MANLGTMPSLATATSTRLDSACKHIQQCRVSQDHMTMFVGSDADELIRNKYRYCVHKDEMVVGITRPLGASGMTKRFQNSAYPRIVSNLGKMLEGDASGPSETEKVLKLLYHFSRSLRDRDELLRIFREGSPAHFPARSEGSPKYLAEQDGKMLCATAIQGLFDLVPVGYANTVGWAHAHCGDTMSSVMIGGLRTVRNGHFEVFTGDVLQWYWPFEKDCFYQDGRRKGAAVLPADRRANGVALPYDLQTDPGRAEGDALRVDQGAAMRRDFRDREYGQKKGVEKAVPMIKPYLADSDDQSIYDWHRVFARAMAPARAFDELDIMIFRQAV